MKIKSYFARSVEDAMTQASQELGPDAMLMNSRKSPPEARHLGDYEVVFATAAADTAAEPPQKTADLPSSPAGARLSKEVSDLKKELEGMRRALTRSIYAPAQWSGASPDWSDAYAQLTSNDVAPDLARDIVESAAARLDGPRTAPRKIPSRAIQKALIEEMESRFQVQAELGRHGCSTRITALVGPPGVGKTTTLVKLAVNYGLASRKPILLLSMDTYRVAAAEQLRSYAAILGVGFQVLETVTALAQTIEEHRGKDLILIDTPGFACGDLDAAAPLAQFLSTRSDIDTQLVLSSSMRAADLSRVADAFAPFAPQRLLYTRLDETGAFGQILNEAVRTGRPLSFFTIGQRIPEDLREATREGLIDLILNGERSLASIVA